MSDGQEIASEQEGYDETISPPNIKYGRFKLPIDMESEGLILSFKREGEHLDYHREYNEETVDKLVQTKAESVIINPVEPVNKPKTITPYLLIELEKPLVIEPRSKSNIYLKFPVEIGIFVGNGKNREALDLLAFTPLKYALYGDPRSGTICKYWKSPVHTAPPATDPLLEGVIQLTVKNLTPDWATLTRAVFNAYGMKLFYDRDSVAINAVMKIRSELVAETDVPPSPPRKGMNPSIELYTSLKPPVPHKKFVMEAGI